MPCTPCNRYGITNEPVAARRYVEVLRSLGHNAIVTCCGLLVDPTTPWLGASPDRVVFDPTEDPPHGIVEIKCPYSLRDKSAADLTSANFCSRVENGVPHLQRSHPYYMQVLGQMAIAGAKWGDFVLYGKEFMLIERIRFCLDDWEPVRLKLSDFYFNTLLPFLGERQ